MDSLCSASRLDRDKGLRQLTEAVENKEHDVIENVFHHLQGFRDKLNGSVCWEQKLGYLTAYTLLLRSEYRRAEIDTEHLVSVCLDWIETEPEVRVREAVGELLGALTQSEG